MAAHLAGLIVGHPALAAAVNKALLGSDPEVQRLRLAIGAQWVERFKEAIGEDADDQLILTLAFALSGALLQAGMGILSYDELPGVLERILPYLSNKRALKQIARSASAGRGSTTPQQDTMVPNDGLEA